MPRAYDNTSREEAAEKTRAHLVAAARAILSNPRSRTTFSLESVAKRARVTRLTVYNQFKNRSGLLEAVFDDVAQTGGLHRLPEVFAEQDPIAGVHRAISIFCEFWRGQGGVLNNLAQEVGRDSALASALAARGERRRTIFRVLADRLPHKVSSQERDDLALVLHALTSFDFYRQLRGNCGSDKNAERLLHRLADAAFLNFQGPSGH